MEHHDHHHKATHEKAHEHKHMEGHHAHSHGDHAGHDQHAGHSAEGFRRKFWLSLALTVPILLLSDMIQHFLGFHLDFPGRKWILFGLSTILFVYGNQPFMSGAAAELRRRNPGMMTLIAMATSVAFLYSVAVTFGLPGMDFYWELATLIVIMLLGHWIEMKTVSGASRALEMLASLMPSEAHVLQADGSVHDHPVQHLKPGDLVLVKANEKIPADGKVTDGESEVNEAMLTGESKPVVKAAGDRVIAGALNGGGALKVEVSGAGQDSYLQKVLRLVQDAQASKSKTQSLADRAARWLTFLALGAGMITLAYWLWSGQAFAFALERMVTVMIIACPHALGLAIPLVVAISTTLSAQHGLLIRNRTAFENARKITAIVFDKTGTLTEGAFGVTRVAPVTDRFSEKEILQLAASLEQNSEHPIAQGIVAHAKEQGVELREVSDFQSLTAQGVKGKIAGKEIAVVSPKYLKDNQLEMPGEAQGENTETLVFVIADNRPIGFIALADRIRKTAAESVAAFRRDGVKVVMATGDNKKVAENVQQALQLDEIHAEVLPHEKVEIVKALQQEGHFVAMTGDGVNDAPALAKADVGIAVGSGTDVAAETADIILVNSNPADILRLLRFGKATYRKMLQNLFWASAYNLVAIPLAAGIFYPKLMISPAFGAVLMSVSTVVVALNAQLLRGSLKPDR
ncbi:MAG: copper-translocating P-type ATPase [Saprospiraceae bacterium]|nr:copper-translocating P-type ATPase [Saprospiraceae bacterium]